MLLIRNRDLVTSINYKLMRVKILIVHISVTVLILAVRLCSVVPVSQVPTNHANVRQ